MCKLAFTIVVASESSFWGFPEYILKPMKMEVVSMIRISDIWRSRSRLQKSCLKCLYKIRFLTLQWCRKVVWYRFWTHRINLEHFYENLFSTSSHGILHLIRGNSRVMSPSDFLIYKAFITKDTVMTFLICKCCCMHIHCVFSSWISAP